MTKLGILTAAAIAFSSPALAEHIDETSGSLRPDLETLEGCVARETDGAKAVEVVIDGVFYKVEIVLDPLKGALDYYFYVLSVASGTDQEGAIPISEEVVRRLEVSADLESIDTEGPFENVIDEQAVVEIIGEHCRRGSDELIQARVDS